MKVGTIVITPDGKERAIIWIDNYSEHVPDPCVRVSGIDGIKYRVSELKIKSEINTNGN